MAVVVVEAAVSAAEAVQEAGSGPSASSSTNQASRSRLRRRERLALPASARWSLRPLSCPTSAMRSAARWREREFVRRRARRIERRKSTRDKGIGPDAFSLDGLMSEKIDLLEGFKNLKRRGVGHAFGRDHGKVVNLSDCVWSATGKIFLVDYR